MTSPALLRTQYAYRITSARDWERAQTEGFVEQSPLDRKDGFYHFSVAAQVPATLGRYFKGVADLVLLQIRCDAFAAPGVLRYDMAPHVKGNNVFPHIYLDRLPLQYVHSVVGIRIDADSGEHVLSLSPLPDRVPADEVHAPARYAHVLVRVPSPAGAASWRLPHVRRALTQAVDVCALDGARLDVCVDLAAGTANLRSASVRSVCTLLHTLYECVSDLAVARADPLLDVRVLLPGLGAEEALERAAAADSRVHVVSVSGGDDAGDALSSCEDDVSCDDATMLHVFEHAVLGGTFDHLHAGHKIMLTVAAASASRSLVIGLSVDELLAKKKHAAHLESYDARVLALRAFLGALKPSLHIDVQPLRDIYGPSVERAELQALIVSEETRAGGAAVNARRIENGMHECQVVVIPLVGGGGGADCAKLSSTDIRRWVGERATLAALAVRLRPGFMRLMHECGVFGDDGDEHSLAAQTWVAVCARYTERHRAYHTLQHISELLALTERCAARIHDRRAFELCVWFHDLVYAAPHERTDLEEQSAADFWSFAHAASLPLDAATRVGRLILATKRHLNALTELDAHVAAASAAAPLNDGEAAAVADARLFLQLDLSIVGADADAYDAYAHAIRHEYNRVPPAEFRAGRGAVLRKFRDAVDEAAPLRLFDALGVDEGLRLRARARENLERELATLV